MAIKGKMTPAGSIQARRIAYTPTQSLSDLVDVDTSNREDGSMVIWDEPSQTFKVQGEMKNPKLFIAGGSF